jgi:acetolactate synthase-1/2/3 large subunit
MLDAVTNAAKRTLVEAIIGRLAAQGVRRIFGVPGGDCNLDFLDAAERGGIEFVLTRSETPAAIMAAVTAELTGTPGVVMTTRGPGLANAINGVAYAQLDRAPLLVIADAYEPDLGHVSHQRMDQSALLAPVVKGWADLSSADPLGEFDNLLAVAAAEPQVRCTSR